MSLLAKLTKQLSDLKSRLQNAARWKQATAGIIVLGAAYKIYKCMKLKQEEKAEWFPNVPHFTAKKIVNCKNKLGECCLWDNKHKILCWIDNIGKKFWIYNPKTQESRHFDTTECVGSFCFCTDNSYLLAFETGPAFYDLITHKLSKKIFNFEPNVASKMNDGRVDRNGRFVVGGAMKLYDENGGNFLMNFVNKCRNIYLSTLCRQSSIYRINCDLSHQILVKDVLCANSICFSLSGDSMYFTDSLKWFGRNAKIMKLDYYNNNRLPSNPAMFTQNCQGANGSVVDSVGNVWTAHCSFGKVSGIDPNGNVKYVVDVPDKYVTCCTFGGEHLDTLYITTLDPATLGMTVTGESNEEFGALYCVKLPNVKGCVENRFGGSRKQLTET